MTISTITSKRQLTIPAKVFKEVGLKEGEKVLISQEDGVIKIESALAAISRLAGSVKVPKKLHGINIDKAIEIAKYRYFKERARK